MAVIEARGIEKRFGKTVAVKDVNLQVRKGEFFGLFGPNGAGKTTLLRVLTGQVKPTSGKAVVLDKDVTSHPIEVKERIGIVPEVESPPSYLTSREFLYFVCKVRKVSEPEKRIRKWVRFFGLEKEEGTICRDLSKGTRQKLMIASALIHGPPLLFLDEPFINLDPFYQRRVRNYVSDFVSRGGTVFMCTHLLEMAEKLCSRVAIMNSGKIIAQGRTDELLKKFGNLEEAFIRIVGRGKE